MISNDEEKLGGLSVTETKVRDFNHCMIIGNLEDKEFKASKFTLWNERTDEECISKRLRCFVMIR